VQGGKFSERFHSKLAERKNSSKEKEKKQKGFSDVGIVHGKSWVKGKNKKLVREQEFQMASSHSRDWRGATGISGGESIV